ncbi:MAG: ribonuclease P protein component [Dehalococcoidia bacterium]
MGLSKESRIKKTADFNHIAETGKSVSNRMLILKWSLGQTPHSRSGFAVSKRIGGAVVRNRVKRLLRESINSLDLSEGYDMVFIARKETAKADYKLIQKSVKDTLKRSGILKKELPI